MKTLRTALVSALILCTFPVFAANMQSHAQIREVARAYVQAQMQARPGKISIEVEDIDRRIALPACSPLEAFLPSGASLMGKTSIGVRCSSKPGWSIFVQATIKVNADILVANRPLPQNTVLSASDFSLQSGELGQPGILTDPAQAVGKTLKFAIGAGQILRQDMLRAPFVVLQGRTTDVRVRSESFTIRASGQALNNGAAGENVQVRMPSGQVVSGMAAADGSVDVQP